MREDEQYPSDDEFGNAEEAGSKGINWVRVFGTSTAIIILAGFAGGIWYAYDQGVKKGVQLAPPIIKADNAPIKIKPKEPGGMEIAHQDKKIFNVLKPEEEELKTEKLMAPVEEATKEPQPVEVPKGLKKPAPEKNVEKLISKTQGTPKSESAMPAVKSPQIVAKALEKPAIDGADANSSKTVPVTKNTNATSTPLQKAAAVSGEVKIYRVQLAAFRSRDAATKQWIALQKKHAELLGNLPHKIQTVKIEGKGQFFRLQAGQFEDRMQALDLCNKLKSEKQDCLIAGS
jgi:sporulation related protein